jgi:hypothetical protein
VAQRIVGAAEEGIEQVLAAFEGAPRAAASMLTLGVPNAGWGRLLGIDDIQSAGFFT